MGGQHEGIGTGQKAPQDAEGEVRDLGVFGKMREIGTDDREGLLRVSPFDRDDALHAALHRGRTPQAIDGIRRVDDDSALFKHSDRLGNSARLRVFGMDVESDGHGYSFE